MGYIGAKSRGQNVGAVVFFSVQIQDRLVLELEKILELEKNNGNGFYSGSCTVNGFQTYTVHENKNYEPVLNDLLSYLPQRNSFYYRWFHLIDYDKFGRQEKHNHVKTEDYSFIVYLTTCNEGGKTFFEVPNEPIFASAPVRGKLLFFPSYLDHWGEEVVDHKKIAVGALKLIQPNT
jgi:hypothetical protein